MNAYTYIYYSVGYNKMSLKGFSYLCDMLKVNHTLVTLW